MSISSLLRSPIAGPAGPHRPTATGHCHGNDLVVGGRAPRPAGRTSRLSDLPPIDLDALVAAGSLQVRVDRKYLVPSTDLPLLLGTLADRASALAIDGHRQFGYRTLYFDTPERDSYLAATRRRPLRFKVRTRTYLDSGACWLEVKSKDRRGRTVKVRQPHDPAQPDQITDAGLAFIAESIVRCTPDPAAQVARLRPALATHYQRATLFLPEELCRATIDTGFLAIEPGGASLAVDRRAFVETKSGSRASSVDRALWAMGHRPTRVSKYATSLAALHAELPAAKWRPALRELGALA